MGIILPKLISDGMVLQRNAEVRIRGRADEPVTLTFLGNRYHADPDWSGNWEIYLYNLPPGGPYTMQINEISIKDVFIGDVWLCSGQSNMQIPMSRVKHMYPEEIESPNPHIRQFTVPQNYDFHGPLDSLD
ncbi:MAG: sialate O-acetylesterase, partial [Bacillota bacterium]|nr:sialate O-acetylesterase [Bacillota bacterium]